MAVWTIGVWLTVSVVFVPISSRFLGRHVIGVDSVKGNEELLSWLLTPIGLSYALLALVIVSVALVIRYAGLFHIVLADLEGRPTAVRHITLRVGRQLPDLVRVCFLLSILAAVAVVVLAAPLAGIYALFLDDYDINYYLAAKPAAWWRALSLAAVWTILWIGTVGFVLDRSVLALPAYLDGCKPGVTALKQSWSRSRKHVGRLITVVLVAVAAWLIVRAVSSAIYLEMATAAFQDVSSLVPSVTGLALTGGLLLAGSVALDATLAFLGFSYIATVLTKCYAEATGLHVTAPPVPNADEIGTRLVRAAIAFLRPRWIVPLAVIAVTLSLVVSNRVLQSGAKFRSVAVAAHRAGPPPAPENTLAALELAIRSGADFAEIDVQRTRDDVVVVVHDADLMRTAGLPIRISDVDYDDLAPVVQGGANPFPAEERRIASLGQFLERARGRIGLIIELKYYGWDPELASRTIELIREARMEKEVTIMSLSLRAVREVQTRAPEIRVAFAAAAAFGDLSRLSVDVLAVARNRATPELLRAAHRRSTDVFVWTLNDQAGMIEAIERGVDGIVTDRPELAVDVTRDLEALPGGIRLLLRFQRSIFSDADP